MLHSANQLTGFSIMATDGDPGSIDTIYFDDASVTKSGIVPARHAPSAATDTA